MLKRIFYTVGLITLIQVNGLYAADYYWVGGSGNWSDITHWVTTSGGTVQHNTIPTASDRVIFDERSFTGPNQIVTVNTPVVFCKDLIWTGVAGRPQFLAPATFVMQIYGSLILDTDMVFNFQGDIVFLADNSGHQIDMAGHTLLRNAVFAGSGGEWNLLTDFQVDSTILLNSGSFRSIGRPVTCELLRVEPTGNLQIDLDTSYVTLTGIPKPRNEWEDPDPVVDIINQPSLTLNASQSTWDFISKDVFFRIQNPGSLRLGSVLFSNTTGKSLLQLNAPDETNLHIEKLIMRNDAALKGPMTFGELQLGEGKNFTFDAGYTYELSKLTAQGTCSAPIQLFSSEPGRAVMLQSDAASVMGSFLSLRDIHGTGGATFTAENSADLGNNVGWTITPKANNKLYWVGGSGNWNDPSNWAVSSGGMGGSCVPTAADDVIFDQNSFPAPGAVVSIDIDNAYCRSMDWTGSTGMPSLSGSFEKNLHVFGSLTFISDMLLSFEGDVFFESNSTDNSITSAGKQFANNVTFDGQGSWLLNDSLNVVRSVFFDKGNLNTNDQVMTFERFISERDTKRSLQLGNSKINIRSADYNYLYWTLNADNLSFDAGTSTIEFFWYGELRHEGTPQLNYHKLITNYGIAVNSFVHKLNHLIDTFEMRGGGYFSSSTQINSWLVFRGAIYEMNQGDTLFVNEIVSPDGCGGMIEFRSNHWLNQAYIDHKVTLTLDRIVVMNMHSVGEGTLTATNSVDLGNSDGWAINQNDGRDLYWVGGTGNWHETEHWSLSSGGPGGECVPTPIDNVFFDENSFLGPNQQVFFDDRTNYCKNLRWQNIPFTTSFSGVNFHLFGSIETSPEVKFDWFYRLMLRSREDNNQIKIGGAGRIDNLEITGSGKFILQDSVQTHHYYQQNGTFHSNGYNVDVQYFTIGGYWETPKTLVMGGSHWKIHGENLPWQGSWSVYGPADFQVDSSLVEFTSPSARIYTDYGLAFNNVLFSATEQQARVEAVYNAKGVFNHLEFRNNGTIIGTHTIDSLIFSPGKSYTLDADYPQEIKEYWEMKGNNCLSIGLASTVSGRQAKVVMNGGVVSADFVQMRDQLAEGSTNFFAGNNSTDIGNSNTGWIFESAEDYIDDGILGKDIVLCENTSFELDGRTYSQGETYLWSTGANTPTIGVNEPGTYWVELNYGDNCSLRDSIILLEPEAFVADLPADTTLCEGDTLLLESTIELLGLQYLWQDGSTQPDFMVNEPGDYKLTLELSGCTTSDSLTVVYTPTPAVDLGEDLLLCPQETTVLDASIPEATAYVWQDGSDSAAFLVATPGNFIATVFNGRCFGSDTVSVAYEVPLDLTLGRDTAICEGDNLILVPSTSAGNKVTYRWYDDSSADTYLAATAGDYWVEATRNGCSERDTVSLWFKPLPRFDLGADTTLCEGEMLMLEANLPEATYLWQDGSTSSTLQVTEPGLFWLQTTLDACVYRDSMSTTYAIFPTDILGEDQTICQGESALLDASLEGATYLWQNGASAAQLQVETEGTYQVIVNLGRCSARDTVNVSVLPLPIFDLGGDIELCAPASQLLEISTTADSYRWQDGSTRSSFTAVESGIFSATAIKDGCSWTDSLRIAIYNPRKPNLGLDTTICEDAGFILRADVDAQLYLWQDGSTGASFEVTSPGEYILSAFEGPCAASDTISIFYRRCTTFKPFIPNAFSPNGDGINDFVRPLMSPDIEVRDYTFRIFDRWGNLVFETNEIDRDWDGTYRGSALPQGVFVYFLYIKYQDDFGEDTAQLTGDILLTR